MAVKGTRQQQQQQCVHNNNNNIKPSKQQTRPPRRRHNNSCVRRSSALGLRLLSPHLPRLSHFPRRTSSRSSSRSRWAHWVPTKPRCWRGAQRVSQTPARHGRNSLRRGRRGRQGCKVPLVSRDRVCGRDRRLEVRGRSRLQGEGVRPLTQEMSMTILCRWRNLRSTFLSRSHLPWYPTNHPAQQETFHHPERPTNLQRTPS